MVLKLHSLQHEYYHPLTSGQRVSDRVCHGKVLWSFLVLQNWRVLLRYSRARLQLGESLTESTCNLFATQLYGS